ncbi:TetR family transcriptional regulator [Alkalibaculum sp. M08DMB]|uniref:TetR family transcriptional regulator n=1 Tax=Alkalibaculum sporogenes TaxID=2655001 RepID=A0A6A7K527_9FIRM|nr:TetR/AcrR family transcriptional regulator [Alkalibaculum sporogenes]MPW24434.1 TetR family transcriptional regulator [Alkalibaculum sporogenes]
MLAQYKKGMDTKHKILQVSKKLFVDNGYVKTSCKMICEEADVNLGLIHYHYKSKKNIASIIYAYFLVEVKELVKRYMTEELHNYELKYATALEHWIFYGLLLGDNRYKIFYYEICKENLLVDENTKILEYFYKLHVNTYNLNISANEIKLIRVSGAALNMGLIQKYVENYFDMTIDELSEYKIRNMYRLLKLKEDEIDDIVEVSNNIYNKINIKLLDYFELSLDVNLT